MRPTSRRCSHLARASGVACALTIVMLGPVFAGPAPQEVLFESSDLKIYRVTSSRGTPVVVLTNLDALGNRLAPLSDDECAPAVSADPEGGGRNTTGTGAPDRPPEGTTTSSSGSVRVVVNQGEGAAPVDERNVEVSADGSGGTTVIININPPPPPERDTVTFPLPPAYPVVVTGGVAGAYRYPNHLYFLGYGPDISSPSLFGGLGLNAANGFGLSSGTPCTRGFDCMFGPKTPRP